MQIVSNILVGNIQIWSYSVALYKPKSLCQPKYQNYTRFLPVPEMLLCFVTKEKLNTELSCEPNLDNLCPKRTKQTLYKIRKHREQTNCKLA